MLPWEFLTLDNYAFGGFRLGTSEFLAQNVCFFKMTFGSKFPPYFSEGSADDPIMSPLFWHALYVCIVNTLVDFSVHSGALAQISGNHICFVAWARAFHAATLLKDQCVVGNSCEVADCSQFNTLGLIFTV